jgi:arginine:ornithine antiporter / lysine permease
MPKVFARENANGVPSAALWATNIVIQLIVISTYWSRDAFSLMLNLTSAMSLIPFLLVAAYGWQITRRGEGYDAASSARSRDLVLAILATIYTVFLLYAGGVKFIVLSAVLYAPGSLLYFWARREQNARVFTKASDGVVLGLATLGLVVGIWWIATGYIEI